MRGRPKKDEKRDYILKVRLTQKEAAELKYLSYLTDKSMSQLIKEGIRIVTNIQKYSD